jgi:UDP-N-acetylmuramoyl-tripeptide--D-alanyl-D-alanine ligase
VANYLAAAYQGEDHQMPDPSFQTIPVFPPTSDEHSVAGQDRHAILPVEDSPATSVTLAAQPFGKKVLIGMERTGKPGWTALAMHTAAKAAGADFFYFTPKDVNLKERNIFGWQYCDGKWERALSPFPDVIDNGENFIETEAGKALLSELPFTFQRLGGKEKVYRFLSSQKEIQKYIIPYDIVDTVESFTSFLNMHKCIVMKPIRGSQGKGLFSITLHNNEIFSVVYDDKIIQMNKDDVVELLIKKYIKRYIMQRYVKSKTQNEMPFDIRIHVCRGRNAQWNIAKIYTRIGMNKNLTSNIAGGGGISDTRTFLQYHMGDRKWRKVYDEINDMGIIIPEYLQKFYPQLINALGIDVGIDADGKPYLFEINGGPGSKFLYLEHALLAAEFAIYLARQAQCVAREAII